jgi:hypothetical protein
VTLVSGGTRSGKGDRKWGAAMLCHMPRSAEETLWSLLAGQGYHTVHRSTLTQVCRGSSVRPAQHKTRTHVVPQNEFTLETVS